MQRLKKLNYVIVAMAKWNRDYTYHWIYEAVKEAWWAELEYLMLFYIYAMFILSS